VALIRDGTSPDSLERMGVGGRAVVHGRRRWVGLLVLPLVTLAACASNGTTSRGSQRVVVPNVVGLSQGAAIRSLAHAGLTVGVISGVPSPGSSTGSVIATNPSSGQPAVSGATVSLTVASGGTAAGSVPTTPDLSSCSSGHVAYTESTATGFVCVSAGSTLRVTFVSNGGWSGFGAWSRSPPTISDNAILTGRTYRIAGKQAVAAFGAVGPGTVTVTAQFDVRCASGDTTPCTVPPQALQVLTVAVVPGHAG
jgi:hypothetical protein